MHRSLFTLFGFGLTIAFSSAEEVSSTSTAVTLPTLEIMTFNIRYPASKDGENHWSKRVEFVSDVIRAQMPDIVGVQEAERSQLDDLAPHLKEFQEIGVGRADGKEAGEYSAILFKKEVLEIKDSGTFWLSDTPEIAGSKTWNNFHARVCTWARFQHKPTAKTFYFFNTHWDNASEEAKEKSSKLMAERILKRKEIADPYIVTGDFNNAENGPAINALKTALGVKDSYRILHPDAKDSGTAHGWSGKQNGAKIDYIFLDPKIQPLESEIIHTQRDGRFPSDHFPVRAKVKFLP